MLQQSCRAIAAHMKTFLLQGLFSCNKIKQIIYFIAAFILFDFIAYETTA